MTRMRKTPTVVMGALTVLTVTASMAQARPITKDGADYASYNNPNGCKILVHPPAPWRDFPELHVSCTERAGATGGATIRYRMRKAVFGPDVEFRAFIETDGHGGTEYGKLTEFEAVSPRVGIVEVPWKAYIHIRWVRWHDGS